MGTLRHQGRRALGDRACNDASHRRVALSFTKLVLLAAAGLCAAAAVFWFFSAGLHTLGVSNASALPSKTISIDGAPVVVEVASTETQREQGLSGRSALPSGRGMLFVFDADAEWGFWMKDMSFAIDMVWLSK